MKQFYTYLHCKPDGIPFYVGKGTLYRSHNFYNRNKHHKNIVQKFGKENIEIFIFPCESESEAMADEIQQIAQLRSEGYELSNYSNGGEGGSGIKQSQETITKRTAKLIGQKRSDETRLRMSKAQKGHKHNLGRKLSEETRAKLSLAHKGNKNNLGNKLSLETRAKISAALKGKRNALGTKHSEETRKKMSKPKSAATRARMSASAIGKIISESARAKMSAAHIGKKKSPATRAKMSVASKAKWNNPEIRKKMLSARKSNAS